MKIDNVNMFDVRKCTALYDMNGQSYDAGHNMIVTVDKDGNRETVNKAVSDNYEIHQPRDILKSFEDVCKRTNLVINNVLTNPHSGALMISALFQNTKIIGDDHNVNVVFYTSHDGKKQTFLTLQALRLACMNQAPMLYKNKNLHMYREKHYADSLKLNEFEGLLEDVPMSVNMYNARCEQLADKKMTREDFVDFYIEHMKYKTDSYMFDSTLNKINEAYDKCGGDIEIANDTAYRAYHTVTYLNTHGLKDTKLRMDSLTADKPKITNKFMNALLVA